MLVRKERVRVFRKGFALCIHCETKFSKVNEDKKGIWKCEKCKANNWEN